MSLKKIIGNVNPFSSGDFHQTVLDVQKKSAAIPFISDMVNATGVNQLISEGTSLSNKVTAMIQDPRYAAYTVVNDLSQREGIIGDIARTPGKIVDAIANASNNIKDKIKGAVTDVKDAILGKVETGLQNMVGDGLDKLDSLLGTGEMTKGSGDMNDYASLGAYERFYNEYKKVMFNGQTLKLASDKEVQYWSDKYGTVLAPFQGWKTIAGFSLDSSHLWDVSLTPYKGSENANNTYLPDPPTKIDDETAWVPAIDYNFEDISVDMDESNLSMNKAAISIPFMINFNNDFSMTIVDDQWGTWFQYLESVVKACVSKDQLCAAPYKHITFLLQLYVLNPGIQIRYLRKLLVVLSGYRQSFVGTEDPNIVTYKLDFKIVGELVDG